MGGLIHLPEFGTIMPHLEMQSLRGPTVTEGNRLAYTIQEILGKIGYDG